jgi:mono/diheme cytochrome c family protein
MSTWTPERTRRLRITLVTLFVVLAFMGWFGWYKFFRVVPQPPFATEHERFLYGSIGAEATAGIPYWIFYVLPRVFPDKLPGPTGYASFGLAWEEGRELPIGFTKKTIGFDRVAQNCAVCHAARYRLSPDDKPKFVATGPNHTLNLEAFFRFLVDCALDPRFSAGALMNEITLASDLSWIDRMIYRFVLIPATRKALLERRPRFAWIYNKGERWPDWGRGRDDAMNLTKYFLTTGPPMKPDDTLGPTDMPSIWNIGKYRAAREGGRDTRMNFAGDSWDANSVIIDSALGLHGAPPASNRDFLEEVAWLTKYLEGYRAPPFPFDTADPKVAPKVARGKGVFQQECAKCHVDRAGAVVPIDEVRTDRERLWSWNEGAARRSNEIVRSFGIERKGLVEENPKGYIAAFLDGIWLRAPYLHNGSVPTLRDLLEPVAKRPQVFYRGYDVYDPIDVGFISLESQAKRLGASWDAVKAVATPYDVRWRSNGNMGHEYGVSLPAGDKDALIEYLKTL